MSGGKFDIRPLGAAPLFDSDSGRAAAQRRWEKQRENTERAIIKKASDLVGADVTLEEAIDLVVSMPQFAQAMAGKTAAAKLVLQMLDRLPGGGDTAKNVDARQVHVNVYQLARTDALRFAEDLREAGKIASAAMVEAQIIDGDGPFEIKVPIE